MKAYAYFLLLFLLARFTLLPADAFVDFVLRTGLFFAAFFAAMTDSY